MPDHDIAGNVSGVELEALSQWQLAALAVECMQEILDRNEDSEGGFEKRVSRYAADVQNTADLLRRVLD